MHDMNFFDTLQKKRNVNVGGLLLKLVLLFLVLGMIGLPAYFYYSLHTIEKDSKAIQATLDLPQNVKTMGEYDAEVAKVKLYQETADAFKAVEKGLLSEGWFTEELLQVVVDALPKQIRLTGLYVTTIAMATDESPRINGFQLEGTATDKPAIAELEYNLRYTNQFDQIYIPSIESAEGELNFVIQFNVKDVTVQ